MKYKIAIINVFLLLFIDYLHARKFTLFWMKECGCTGMNEEAVTLLYALSQHPAHSQLNLISNKCTDSCGRPPEVEKEIKIIEDASAGIGIDHATIDVAIIHYAFRGVCGRERKVNENSYVIARAMYEADRLPKGVADRCNDFYDEIWVPTEFNKDVFLKAGVLENKIFKIPEAVYVDKLNPEDAFTDIIKSQSIVTKLPLARYNFYSNFKWETRKNWKGLLDAFTSTFNSSHDDVALFIKTHRAWEGDPIRKYERTKFTIKHRPWSCRVYFITERLTTRELIYLYKKMDAFVLPTHGEGWGLPTMEAMAMGMPVITTNWGGSTEFVNEKNSFLIPVESMTNAFKKTRPQPKWANPSTKELGKLMRYVYENPQQAQLRGKQAREDVVKLYNLKPISQIIMRRLAVLSNIVRDLRLKKQEQKRQKENAKLARIENGIARKTGEDILWEKIRDRINERKTKKKIRQEL